MKALIIAFNAKSKSQNVFLRRPKKDCPTSDFCDAGAMCQIRMESINV